MKFFNPLVDESYVSSLANKIWTPNLEILEVICGASPETPASCLWASQNKTRWTVTKNERGDFIITDWYLASKQNLYNRWKKLLGEPVVPPEDRRLRPRWEEEIQRRVIRHGAAAPNRLT